MFSQYSVGSLKGSVKLIEDKIAKLQLLVFLSGELKLCPLAVITPLLLYNMVYLL